MDLPPGMTNGLYSEVSAGAVRVHPHQGKRSVRHVDGR